MLDRGVFRRQLEAASPTPSGASHTESTHATVAKYTTSPIVTGMAHVQSPRWVRQHFQRIVLRLQRIGIDLKRMIEVLHRACHFFSIDCGSYSATAFDLSSRAGLEIERACYFFAARFFSIALPF